jgi:hypothetical protein
MAARERPPALRTSEWKPPQGFRRFHLPKRLQCHWSSSSEGASQARNSRIRLSSRSWRRESPEKRHLRPERIAQMDSDRNSDSSCIKEPSVRAQCQLYVFDPIACRTRQTHRRRQQLTAFSLLSPCSLSSDPESRELRPLRGSIIFQTCLEVSQLARSERSSIGSYAKGTVRQFWEAI